MKKKLQTLKSNTVLFVRLLLRFDVQLAVLFFLKSFLFKKNQSLHTMQYNRLKSVLVKKYSLVLQKYQNQNKVHRVVQNKKCVWMIWWQGIDESTPPRIVQNIKHIKQMMPDYEVSVVSRDNYMEFVKIPDYIMELIQMQKLSMTHISDYLRVLLLEQYGGIYIDCNFYPMKGLDFVSQYSFYTIRHGLFSDWHVCKGLWTTGFLAAEKGQILFSFVKEMYDNFFLDYDFVPSYFFIDALIAIAYENIPAVKAEVDRVPLNNSRYNFINESGNEPFDRLIWDTITEDTFLLNANYKYDFVENKGKQETFYGHLYHHY